MTFFFLRDCSCFPALLSSKHHPVDGGKWSITDAGLGCAVLGQPGYSRALPGPVLHFGANLAHFCGPLCSVEMGAAGVCTSPGKAEKSLVLHLISQGCRGHFLSYSPGILRTSSRHPCARWHGCRAGHREPCSIPSLQTAAIPVCRTSLKPQLRPGWTDGYTWKEHL